MSTISKILKSIGFVCILVGTVMGIAYIMKETNFLSENALKKLLKYPISVFGYFGLRSIWDKSSKNESDSNTSIL